MEFIAHRINTVAELKQIPKNCGIEVDLRPQGDELILAHDPFVDGENFESLLQEYSHGTLILNIKSERIEFRVKELLDKYQVFNYFFLDSSLPMINHLVNQGERKMAIRFSELEPIELLRSFAGKVEWVWVDCFTKFILDKKTEKEIHSLGFKICLVSPELQGRPKDISTYLKAINEQGIAVDAVCSKFNNREVWEK